MEGWYATARQHTYKLTMVVFRVFMLEAVELVVIEALLGSLGNGTQKQTRHWPKCHRER